MTLDLNVEQGEAHWEHINFSSTRDLQDIANLENEEVGKPQTPLDGREMSSTRTLYELSKAEGRILRRGNRAIGYVLYNVAARVPGVEVLPALNIKYVYISKKERAKHIRTLVEHLKQDAQSRGLRSIAWAPSSDITADLSKNLGQGENGGYGRISFSLEDFTYTNLMDVIRNTRRKSRIIEE